MTNNAFASALNKKTSPTPNPVAVAPHSAAGKVKRRHIGGYFDPEIARRLRMLASEEETTVQELLAELFGSFSRSAAFRFCDRLSLQSLNLDILRQLVGERTVTEPLQLASATCQSQGQPGH